MKKKLGKGGKSATKLLNFAELHCFVISGCMTEKSKGDEKERSAPIHSPNALLANKSICWPTILV